MKKILIALGLALAAFIYIIMSGGTYESSRNVYIKPGENTKPEYEIEQGGDVIRITDFRLEGENIKYTVHAIKKGKATVWIDIGDSKQISTYYVHPTGVITEDSRLGNCTGAKVIILLITVYAAILLGTYIEKYRKGLKDDFYNYHNITLLGVCIFVSCFIPYNLAFMYDRSGILDAVRGLLSTASTMALIAIPITFLAAILIIISNISLMRHEGVNRKNLLGTFFSVLFMLILFFPIILENWLQRQNLIDVHKENGWGNYFDMVVTRVVYVSAAYLFVILVATIVMGFVSARRTPAFDKDYILILGCRVRKDGTPTPLLKGRADAALKFAQKQKAATGKDIIFVPSGGQGKDEAVSEAECIKNYLLSCGVEESRILVEDRSRNTYENFRFSVDKINDPDAKLAFATTSYHVFRSGFIASRNGMKADGVGARTKAYFGINAFIRELIATLEYEKKKHFTALGMLAVAVAVMQGLIFLSILI